MDAARDSCHRATMENTADGEVTRETACTGLMAETLELVEDKSATGRISEAGVATSEAMPGESARGGEANDMTCAICLDQIELEELAVVKGCDHVYCAKCILSWAALKDPPACPQCKTKFSYLITYRHLDGTFSDFPIEESVCLLKRAHWFEEQCKAAAGDKGADSINTGGSVLEEADWADYGHFYEEFDDDEEVEAYYFSAAAGRARIVLGNRRWGENGFVSSGRMHARPAPRPAPRNQKASKAGPSSKGPERSAAEEGSLVNRSAPKTPAQGIPRQAALDPASGPLHGSDMHDEPDEGLGTPVLGRQVRRGSVMLGSSPGSGGDFTPGSSGDKQGRRARRNARRAAADARGGLVFH